MRHYAWLLGFRSVIQHARRNSATALAIGFGYIALILVFGYGTRVSDYFAVSTIFLQQSGHVTVFKKDGMRKRLVRPAKYSLKPEDVQAIEDALRTRPEFDFSAPYMMGSGLVGNGSRSYLFSGQGFVPEIEARIQTRAEVRQVVGEPKVIEKGESLWKAPTKAQVSLGIGLARKLGKAEDPAKDPSVQILSRDYDKRISVVEADISSIFKTGLSGVDNTLVQMPLALMQELFASDSISYLSLFLKDKDKAPELAEYLMRSMEKAGHPIDALVWNDVRLNPNYVNGIAILNVSLLFVSIIVLVVVLLSILNTLTIGLAESRREIGTLRAIGYKPMQVAAIFAVEAGVVCLFSLVVGGILAKILVELVASMNIPFRLPGLIYSTTFQITPTLQNFAQCAGLLLGLAVLTTLWTTRSYAKRDILSLLDAGG